jgi:O-antigen ligase
MSIKPSRGPINRPRFSTLWIGGTGGPSGGAVAWGGRVLFLAAVFATLGIGIEQPLLSLGYEALVLLLAALCCFIGPGSIPKVPALAMMGIGLWGFGQLAAKATVYRFATLETGLRDAAMAATAWVAFCAFRSRESRERFLRWFSWFGALVAVAAVLGYFTSPGKILWIFPSPYPDIWGCFPSRNNFAQFLELAMPPALWFALRKPSTLYTGLAATMLAAGLASASRAGAVVLVLEACALLFLQRKSAAARRAALGFGVATVLFAALPGVSVLAGRFASTDPFEGRREIAHSTVKMIAARPWTGYGLGTFPQVYPQFATFDAGRVVDHAHDDWLEWTAEGGLLFGFLWLVLAAQAIVPAWRSGWGIGVLGCFVHATVDYPFARVGISAWVFILLGMLAAAQLREVPLRKH